MDVFINLICGDDHVTSSYSPNLGQTTLKSLSFQGKTTKEDTSSVVHRQCHNCKKNHVRFVIKDTTLKEDVPRIILHQSHNYRQRSTKYCLLLKPQLQKKMQQVWFVIKVATAKEDASCVICHQSHNYKRRCT
ncbi:hypothetical protein H5410_036457 [Solanum commersonii]|uniref:Uncharacterized protein n=1 Tax=Solanum commersonii TaxID=4109 RepID=A0A9J5Y498_SOLCO|nr:hypothetical protein H5410_036457 [Solanum commersonii]